MRIIASLASAAMVASLFFAWIVLPVGAPPTPYQAFDAFRASGVSIGDAFGQLADQSLFLAIALVIFLASLALAVLFGILGLIGTFPKSMRLLIGLLVAAIAFGFLWQISDQVAALNEGLGGEGGIGGGRFTDMLTEILGPGAYLYFGGGAVLLLAGLLDFSR